MKRTVGSGSEPTYLPRMSNTSCAGLVLYDFGAARTLAAVLTSTTRAIAVFVNMVGLRLVLRTLADVRAYLGRQRTRGKSPGCLGNLLAAAAAACDLAPSNRYFSCEAWAPEGHALVPGLKYRNGCGAALRTRRHVM